MADIFI